jgi:hypothetical protein
MVYLVLMRLIYTSLLSILLLLSLFTSSVSAANRPPVIKLKLSESTITTGDYISFTGVIADPERRLNGVYFAWGDPDGADDEYDVKPGAVFRPSALHPPTYPPGNYTILVQATDRAGKKTVRRYRLQVLDIVQPEPVCNLLDHITGLC